MLAASHSVPLAFPSRSALLVIKRPLLPRAAALVSIGKKKVIRCCVASSLSLVSPTSCAVPGSSQKRYVRPKVGGLHRSSFPLHQVTRCVLYHFHPPSINRRFSFRSLNTLRRGSLNVDTPGRPGSGSDSYFFMPHAVNNDTMGEPAVNGEKVHSQFINVSALPTCKNMVIARELCWNGCWVRCD